MAGLAALGACSSSASNAPTAAGRALAKKVVPPPSGYVVDATPGANGQITPAVFATFGGARGPSSYGYVAGFKGNYVDRSTSEGISVTILQFKNATGANSYLKTTATRTLSFVAPTYAPYPPIPGAIAIDGTKVSSGNYDHAVAMARGRFYALFVYATTAPAPAPLEFAYWVKDQYTRLT
jgi:hypothetical protein